MSQESARWTELSQPQAAFFTAQVDAASQTVFGPAAHEAGIMPLHASRFSFQIDNRAHETYVAVVWPDPYQQHGTCFVTSKQAAGAVPRSFARAVPSEDGFAIEGVALGLSYGRSANLYGYVPCDERMDVYQAGIGFIAAGLHEAKTSEVKSLGRLPLSSSEAARPSMVGVRGDTTARLFRSLSSLGSNLMIAGASNEKPMMFTSQAYDMAQSLLRVAVARIHRADNPERGSQILHGEQGRLVGAIFETGDGITLVRRSFKEFPSTIAVTTAQRPRVDDNALFVEQYSVSASGATFDTALLPAEGYDPAAIISAALSIKTNTSPEDSDIVAALDEAGMLMLEQKLSRLLIDRLSEPA